MDKEEFIGHWRAHGCPGRRYDPATREVYIPGIGWEAVDDNDFNMDGESAAAIADEIL